MNTSLEKAIETEEQIETARSIHRQAAELQRGSGFAMGPLNKPIETPQFPTIQQQIDYWNKKEGEELERVSRIQEAESRDATNETREGSRPNYKARLANGLELTVAMELERQRDCLRIALEDVELRTTQAQIASRIGKQTKERRISFLTGQLEQIGKFARESVEKGGRP